MTRFTVLVLLTVDWSSWRPRLCIYWSQISEMAVHTPVGNDSNSAWGKFPVVFWKSRNLSDGRLVSYVDGIQGPVNPLNFLSFGVPNSGDSLLNTPKLVLNDYGILDPNVW